MRSISSPCFDFGGSSRFRDSSQKRTLSTSYENCKPVVATTEFIKHSFRSSCACPSFTWPQSIGKSVRCISPMNAWLLALIDSGSPAPQAVNRGSIAMNLKPVDADYRSASIYHAYKEKRTVMDRDTILNGSSGKNFSIQLRLLPLQLPISKCCSCYCSDSTKYAPKFPSHQKYPQQSNQQMHLPSNGVVVNFSFIEGPAGGGTHEIASK